MLFNILASTSMSFTQKLLMILITLFCVLLSLTVHEVGHGFAAYLMGDRTAKYSGRLSMNPLRHFDPIGGLCLFLFGFGWAKPVPVNPYNFNNQKAGMVLTSLAGPLTNFIMAFIAQVIVTLLQSIGIGNDVLYVIYMICYYLIIINLGLGLFNLIPVPPLDGSKILSAVLPTDLYFKYMQYERFGFIVLILLINFGPFNRILNLLMNGVMWIYDLVIGVFIH